MGTDQEKFTTSDSVPAYIIKEEEMEYKSERDFTSLDAWKKARRIKLFFYNSILPKLPKKETYQLGAQIRDASVSCTANIADSIIRKVSNTIGYPALQCMN